MNDLQSGVETLTALDPAAVAQLEQSLGTTLSVAEDNPYMTVRKGEAGNLDGIALAKVELRTMKDDPARTLLVVDLAEPVSGAASYVKEHWPDAGFLPARPHAPGSTAYWTSRQGDAEVRLGTTADKDGVTSIVVDRMGSR